LATTHPSRTSTPRSVLFWSHAAIGHAAPTTAAAYTNYPQAARELLTAYAGAAHIGKVPVTPGAATGTRVPFTVEATVSYGGKSRPLSYRSTLTVVRGETTHRPPVDRRASVVHPRPHPARSSSCAP
jgi:hypothetical protein